MQMLSFCFFCKATAPVISEQENQPVFQVRIFEKLAEKGLILAKQGRVYRESLGHEGPPPGQFLPVSLQLLPLGQLLIILDQLVDLNQSQSTAEQAGCITMDSFYNRRLRNALHDNVCKNYDI